MIVGIDLGTTNSLIAHLTADGPQLITNALGSVLTPSVVGVDEHDRWLVGQAAREYQVTQPARCASAFKRHMGSDWKVTLGGHRLGAVELSSMVLRSLKADAEDKLGQPIDEAVITVPAYFNEPQRQATIQAGRLAGLQVRRILNEPTAAALAYGVHEAQRDCVILVFDLGGGTFDVSIMDRMEGVLEIRASAGEVFLGGEDFTTALAARILESQGGVFERAELETPLLVSRLRHECEAAKRVLSRHESAVVRIPDRDGRTLPDGLSVVVLPADFAAWTSHILARTDGPLRRALGDARLTPAQIDEVLLVGGATRMPTVRQRVAELFGREAQCRLNPDEVVALGAAVQAGLIMNDQSLADVVVTDVSPFTLGVEVSKDIGGQSRGGYFDPIINRNTTIPVSRVRRYSTTYPNQTEVTVRLFQGENRRAKDNVLLGEFSLQGIPRGPAGQGIDIRFTYDLNGILEVEATVAATGKKATHVVTRFAGHLSDLELTQALARMQSLKIHPRDEAANQHALKWAERVFRELSLPERQQLEELLDGFESALEEQDRSLIASYRSALEDFLNAQSGDRGGVDDEQGW
jgi:molecular chaperone HscC